MLLIQGSREIAAIPVKADEIIVAFAGMGNDVLSIEHADPEADQIRAWAAGGEAGEGGGPERERI